MRPERYQEQLLAQKRQKADAKIAQIAQIELSERNQIELDRLHNEEMSRVKDITDRGQLLIGEV